MGSGRRDQKSLCRLLRSAIWTSYDNLERIETRTFIPALSRQQAVEHPTTSHVGFQPFGDVSTVQVRYVYSPRSATILNGCGPRDSIQDVVLVNVSTSKSSTLAEIHRIEGRIQNGGGKMPYGSYRVLT